ncbi:DUF4190 domain-containing protein [Gordonia liuliyuniae]|uniref:DUF4190 domain-containing protein n=1 Tax=Gordonia liuliyuniae TaxID=2911517 RepID=A0ABS9IUC6_9ACTN|nr:DUF4190 domain-containing protein [Gordonia liuliyuniae]MCF8589105.1 DUF4190 domain-containing protein [Gordonia liuliyuniae]
MPASTATPPRATSDDAVNVLAIVALVLSGLGITSPFGIWLGYRSRNEIDRDGGIGREFASAAIIVGWLWILCIVLGLIAFLWILI